MRTQYHFWPGQDGLDAWEVARLIELSRELPVEEVSIDTIHEIDTVYWFDDMHPPTVREVVDHIRLVAEVDPRWPVLLGPDGRVMDGMHRIARALLEGRRTITARRFPVVPQPDRRNCRPGDLPYD